MFKPLISIAMAATALSATAAVANPIVVEGLRLPALEAAMPRDPLLASNDAINQRHYTPAAELADAQAQISRAIPVGTPTDTALARLRNAGAHCRVEADGQDARCSYFDVQTVDEYVDGVHWNTNIGLNNGAVRTVSLERYWTRH